MAEPSLPNSNSKAQVCNQCGSEKSSYKDKRYPASTIWRCNPCTNVRIRERYHQHLEASREKGRQTAARYRETHARYYRQNKERLYEQQKQRRSENPEKRQAYERKYREEHADRLKEYNREYYKANRESQLAAYRENYRKDPEKIKAQAKEWAKNNPARRQEITNTCRQKRRAQLAEVANTLTTAQWDEIKLRFGNRCAYCQKKRKLTRDHITPISDKGPNAANNIAPACVSCNSKKHKGPPLVPVQPLLIA